MQTVEVSPPWGRGGGIRGGGGGIAPRGVLWGGVVTPGGSVRRRRCHPQGVLWGGVVPQGVLWGGEGVAPRGVLGGRGGGSLQGDSVKSRRCHPQGGSVRRRMCRPQVVLWGGGVAPRGFHEEEEDVSPPGGSVRSMRCRPQGCSTKILKLFWPNSRQRCSLGHYSSAQRNYFEKILKSTFNIVKITKNNFFHIYCINYFVITWPWDPSWFYYKTHCPLIPPLHDCINLYYTFTPYYILL